MKKLSLILAVVFCMAMGATSAFAGEVDNTDATMRVTGGAVINASLMHLSDANVGTIMAGHSGLVDVASVDSHTSGIGVVVNAAIGSGAYSNIGSVVAKSVTAAVGTEDAVVTSEDIDLHTGAFAIVNMSLGVLANANVASVIAQ